MHIPRGQHLHLDWSLYRVYFVVFTFCFFKDEIRTRWESGCYMEISKCYPSFSVCNEICKTAGPQPMSGVVLGQTSLRTRHTAPLSRSECI